MSDYTQIIDFSRYLTLAEKAPATVEKYTRDARKFLAFLDTNPLTKDAVLAYKTHLREDGRSVVGINATIAAVNAYLDFLQRSDCKIKPFRVQKTQFRNVNRELSRDEYARLLTAAHDARNRRLWLILQVIGSTGIRVSELAFLTAEAVRSGQMVVTNKGKTRVVPLTEKLCVKLTKYGNRIGRGRSYVKNGFVLDLKMAEGVITALVSGSSVYKITIKIDPLSPKKWESISGPCAKRIDSLAALCEGKFPEEFGEVFMKQGDGLFPSPKEIHMDCNCLDWADMCKHLAAALYAVGAKLDADPLLFFTLRGIDPSVLIKKSVDEKMKSLLANAEQTSERMIADEDIARIFGL